MGWAGIRTATRCDEVTAVGNVTFFGNKIVNGPGQNLFLSLNTDYFFQERKKVPVDEFLVSVIVGHGFMEGRDMLIEHIKTIDMNDQRIIARPALDGINLCNGFWMQRVRSQTIHRFGRDGNGVPSA